MTTISKERSERDKRRKELVVAAMFASRDTADRVLDRTALRPAELIWEQQMGRLATGLSRAMKLSLREPATPGHVVQALGWLKLRIPSVAKAIGDVLGNTTRQVVTEGYDATAALVGQIRGATIPLDALHLRNRVILGRTNELSRLRAASANNLASDIHKSIHSKIIAITPEQSVGDLVSLAHQYLDEEDWRVERLVRYQTSFAYNGAANDAIGELGSEPEFSGMCKRWTEHISDIGMVLDNKVAHDSVAIHGQIAKPDGVFVQPEGSCSFGGKTFLHSPNRPNDRSVTTPWMKEWNIPGWKYSGWVDAV